ncbi:MAG TPA: type II toxin-antitoxin system VapC family toxin [Candidatus Kapabacteria bacterium]|nr:type II toxin-antitoxin system VapC family toxin [Candidatus Kapabacteria bacterium]
MRPVSEGVLIETDVLADFLLSPEPSLLRKAFATAPCYTTVINAAELFSAVRDEREREAVQALLSGLRVIGLSARYAATIGETVREVRQKGFEISERDAIVIGTAVAARLPVMTKQWSRKYEQYGCVHVVSAKELE